MNYRNKKLILSVGRKYVTYNSAIW